MGFLLLSKAYPTREMRQAFFQSAGPDFMAMTAPLYQALPASATTDEWRILVRVIQEQHANQNDKEASLKMQDDDNDNHKKPRPLKPNDDNYASFGGPQWNVSTKIPTDAPLPPSLAAVVQRMQADPVPHYNHCANCTLSAATQQCTRCRIVKYCNRTCQRQHWRSCHRASCEPARSGTSLLQALTTNEGFWINAKECQVLAQILLLGNSGETTIECNNNNNNKDASLIRCFAAYFACAANLEGCFVL